MSPGRLVKHLEKTHSIDWADDLDADAANRLHRDDHERKGYRHGHVWAGNVADPQPPMRADG